MIAYKTREEITKRCVVIIAESLGLLETDFKMESNFEDDLHIDSLDYTQTVHRLEKEFAIKVPDIQESKYTTTVATIIGLVWHRCKVKYHLVN